MEIEQTIEFVRLEKPQCYVPLKDFEDSYEILNQYPFTIRKKKTHKVIAEGDYRQDGYVYVRLNGKRYAKHRLIAKQFIPNDDPENKVDVDHKNHDKTDYHLSNIRWCTKSENARNKYGFHGIKYNYVDELPEGSQRIVLLNGYEFEDYYISPDNTIWFDNSNQYRPLTIYQNSTGGYKYVRMIDILNISRKVGLNTILREYGK